MKKLFICIALEGDAGIVLQPSKRFFHSNALDFFDCWRLLRGSFHLLHGHDEGVYRLDLVGLAHGVRRLYAHQYGTFD